LVSESSLSTAKQFLLPALALSLTSCAAIDLIQGAGFSQGEAKLLAGFNNLSYMFSVLFAVFTLDRFGRRSTMVWGAAGMALLLLIGGILDKCDIGFLSV
jgi:MFS family permease